MLMLMGHSYIFSCEEVLFKGFSLFTGLFAFITSIYRGSLYSLDESLCQSYLF